MSDGGNGDGSGDRGRVPDRIEWLFGRLVGLSTNERLAVSLAAVVVAIGLGMIVVLLAGAVAACDSPGLVVFGFEFCYDPIQVYLVLFDGAFGTRFNVAATLRWTTVFLFTGLSFAIAYKAGLFNIGAQGQFLLGSLATVVVILALEPHVPGGTPDKLVFLPAGILAGTVVGALYGWLPGYLKHRFEVNEVISTLLLNFIAQGVAFVIVDRHFSDPMIPGTTTPRLPEEAMFSPRLFPSSADFSIAVLAFALVVVVGFYWLLRRTTVGYDIRAMGTQPKAAVFGGVDERFTTVFSFVLAGGVAGLGGAVFAMMVLGRWQTGAPPVGFDGIAVSILAGNNPIGLFPSGVLFGALESGSREIERQLGIPSDLVGVLRGLIILLVATPELFRMLGKRLDRRGTIDVGGEN
jgi:ABC-type uncharacterized transport system permease subunit